MEQQLDNYDKVIMEWQEKAKGWDYKERYEALELEGYSPELLPIRYYGVLYHLNPKTGVITDAEHPGRKLSFSTAMAIYHVFYYSKPKPFSSKKWVPIRELREASVFEYAFKCQNLEPFAKAFSGKIKQLRQAGEKLGFRPIQYSDVGFEASIFPFLSIRFLFWDGDEEFPAQANVLFDYNITDYVHAETAIMIGGDGLTLLRETAGL